MSGIEGSNRWLFVHKAPHSVADGSWAEGKYMAGHGNWFLVVGAARLKAGGTLTSKRVDSRQMRLDLEAKRFMDGWDWEDIHRSWKRRLGDFGVQLQPVFTEIIVHDPHFPTGREQHLTWCPSEEIAEYRLSLQRHYDQYPGTYGPLNRYIQRRGELDTLLYLWRYKDQSHALAGILIAASLFARMGSTRGNYPETWPPRHCVRQLAPLALGQWGEVQFPWHYSCTKVLPFSSRDWEYTLTDISGLVRYLAVEHASILLRYRPIVIFFQREREPLVEKQLRLEYEREAKEWVLWEQERERTCKLEQEREEKLMEEHPRYRQWSEITREELEELVWSMPTVQVAKLYGVSDSAVGKRCRALGVAKPSRGFWAQVQSGRRPHPEGKPQKD
jgi:hypothetical protein